MYVSDPGGTTSVFYYLSPTYIHMYALVETVFLHCIFFFSMTLLHYGVYYTECTIATKEDSGQHELIHNLPTEHVYITSTNYRYSKIFPIWVTFETSYSAQLIAMISLIRTLNCVF